MPVPSTDMETMSGRAVEHSVVSHREWALPPFALPVAFGIFVIAGWGENTLLGLISIIVFLLGFALFWRPGEPPILLYIFGFQWLQASMGVFRANWLGIPIDELSFFSKSMGESTLLSLVGLGCLAA